MSNANTKVVYDKLVDLTIIDENLNNRFKDYCNNKSSNESHYNNNSP
ncbi:2034_t:CDS:2 [Funneliformis caledonium]|uniref:2034_t:CDS:1 n=1 Tax=Funneliformis caledonium TaxID=1117310 RepID=A0A9N9CL72_9GLOM|nr:2034_t:CDS:2 [Funneliformis caledonium]